MAPVNAAALFGARVFFVTPLSHLARARLYLTVGGAGARRRPVFYRQAISSNAGLQYIAAEPLVVSPFTHKGKPLARAHTDSQSARPHASQRVHAPTPPPLPIRRR